MAPLPKNPQHILDCGTGTGIWALDIGEVFPSAEVIGVDLSPIQPEWCVWRPPGRPVSVADTFPFSSCRVVPNVRFEVDDLDLDWTYRRDHFDFIHSRNIAQSIRDWPKYLRQMYKRVSPARRRYMAHPLTRSYCSHTKPGGYIELAEGSTSLCCNDGTFTGSALESYLAKLRAALQVAGFTLPTGEALKAFVEDAGFVDVQLHPIKQPWGAWPKDPEMKKVGQIIALTCATGLEVRLPPSSANLSPALTRDVTKSYGMAPLTRYLGMKPEQVLAECAESLAEVNSCKVHAYQLMLHVVGRKPEGN